MEENTLDRLAEDYADKVAAVYVKPYKGIVRKAVCSAFKDAYTAGQLDTLKEIESGFDADLCAEIENSLTFRR